jgi:hypothetical protein
MQVPKYRLPVMIAGPMIRRATVEAVHIWFITTKKIDHVCVRLFDEAMIPVDAETEDAEPLQLGEFLFLYLCRVVPAGNFLPHDEIVFYDIGFLQLEDQEDTFLTLLDEIADQIVHSDHQLPSFLLQAGAENDLRALYGSCRKLHGPGIDLMTQAETRIRETIEDRNARPQTILLGGDQIYADDVSEKLIFEINKLGRHLIGSQNAATLVRRTVLGRQDRLARHGFTSTNMHWHLETMGEFVALYLLAWNGELWDQIAVKVRVHPSPEERGRDGAYAARFVFANCVTYMMFDDHEVTDDWNFDPKWEKYVYRFKNWANPDSKAVKGGGALADIIVNALVAFWIFQGYGNNPDAYSDDFRKLVGEFCVKDRNRPAVRRKILGFHDWTFVAPTSPPVAFLDCRTRRSHDPVLGERIIDAPGLKQLNRIIRDQMSGAAFQPLIVMLPTPFFDIIAKENAQAGAKRKRNAGIISKEAKEFRAHPNFDDATEKDAEGFGVFEQSVLDLFSLFAILRVQPLVVLCGDVHYAFEQTFSFTYKGRVSVGVQLCSSSLKNQPLGMELNLLDAAEPLPRTDVESVPRDGSDDDRRVSPWPGFYGNLTSTGRIQWSRHKLDYKTYVEIRRSINKGPDWGHYLPWNNLGEVHVTGRRVRNRYHYESGARVVTSPYCTWDTRDWPVLPEELRP